MAEAAVIAEKASSDISEGSTASRKKATPKRKSDIDMLEGKFNSKMATLEQKLDRVLGLVTDEANSAARRPVNQPLSLHNSLNRDYGLEDAMSFHISDSERRNCGFMSDSRSELSHHSSSAGNKENQEFSDRFVRYVSNSETQNDSAENSTNLNKKLVVMFGEDAQTKRERNTEGIILDESQKEIISQSYRSEHPERLTSFKDSYRSSFPVHESCDKFFKVPTLDDTIESLLVKKHGHKAAFSHTPSLYSKSMRSIERLAYQGQMASRMGMIMSCYSQQTLGSLLESLQQKDCNIDMAVQMVRDIFAMSTKTLDQIARAGAFDHMIRRRATLYDTGLGDLKDYTSTVNSLPLQADGVFGPEFDSKLKSKVERDKQLTKLLPDSLFKPKKNDSVDGYKRKSFGSTEQAAKRQRTVSKFTGNTGARQTGQFSGGFRIPRQNFNNRDGQRKMES